MWDRPITVLSWYRTLAWNRRVGGARKSRHLEGDATDIVIEGVDPALVYAKIVELIKAGKMLPGGVGKYPTFTHYDTRGRNARWSSPLLKETK